jgi:hypothetical protein
MAVVQTSILIRPLYSSFDFYSFIYFLFFLYSRFIAKNREKGASAKYFLIDLKANRVLNSRRILENVRACITAKL